MTAPTIPPQQPEPERVCGNCEFYRERPCGPWCWMVFSDTSATDTCTLFRARKES